MPPGSTELSDAEFVVVANRLPVDLEKLPDGTATLEAEPRRAGHRAGPDAAQPRGRLGRLARALPDVDVDPLVEDGLQLHPVPLSAQEVEDYYEGFSNGTLWPLYHDVIVAAGLPPALVAGLRARSTSGSPRRSPRSPRRAPRSGCRTTSCSCCRRMLRELRPDLRIGFFLHIPFPPTELFMQLPWRRRIIEGLLGADLVGFHTPGGARNFRLLAARLTDAAGRAAAATRSPSTAGSCKLGAFPISIDSAALDELAADPRGPGAGQAAAQRPRRPGARSSSGSTGSTTPRASTSGCARSRSCSSRSKIDDEHGHDPDRHAEPGAGRALHSGCATTSSSRSGGSTATYARVGPPGAALPAPVAAARGAGRVLRGRRRDAGDAAARRDEPGGQGVRGLPARRRRRAGAVRVRRRRDRAEGRAAGQPARHRRGEGRAAHGADHEPGRGPAADAGACAARCCTHDVDRWARSFLDALGLPPADGRPPDDRARRGRARAGRRRRGCWSPWTSTACSPRSSTVPVATPARCRPRSAAIEALAALPDTTVALVSGRGLADLAAVSGFGAPVQLIGSHGGEFADADGAGSCSTTRPATGSTG